MQSELNKMERMLNDIQTLLQTTQQHSTNGQSNLVREYLDNIDTILARLEEELLLYLQPAVDELNTPQLPVPVRYTTRPAGHVPNTTPTTSGTRRSQRMMNRGP